MTSCKYCYKEQPNIETFLYDDGEIEVFCDMSCLCGYIKKLGLLTRDDFPATDRVI
jgi:hypothetical protein